MAQKKKSTSKKNTKSTQKTSGAPKELLIIIGVAIAAFLELSNFGILGQVGGWLKYGQFGMFGLMAYLFPLFILALFLIGALCKSKKGFRIFFCLLLFLTLCAFTQLVSRPVFDIGVLEYFKDSAENLTGGGLVGGAIALGLFKALSRTGAIIIAVILIIVFLALTIRFPVFSWIRSHVTEREPHQEPVRQSKQTRQPERQADPNTRTIVIKPRRPEREVFTTDNEGTIIRVVHVPSKHPLRRASLKRAGKKARPLRDGTTLTNRTENKAKGLGRNLAMVSQNARGDEVHEITNAKPAARVQQQVAEPPKKSIEVTDVAGSANAAAQAMYSNTQKAKPVQEKPAPKERTSLSGTTLSKGEPQRTFKPTTTVRKGPDTYKFPPLDLLGKKRNTGTATSRDEMAKVAKSLETILATYGVNANVVNMQAGPSVTRYDIRPELGTKVSKIKNLEDDLKMNLGVPEMRLDLMPERQAIGIEIPNKVSQGVTLRELLEDPNLKNHKSSVAFGAGRDISGNVIIGDISEMPHLLIAGTTGSGKSIFTKSIIMTILYRARPDDVGLIIVDPKKVEFNVFEGVPHLMKSIVTDAGQAISTLRWAVNEMSNRYTRMQLSGVRDFKSYNAKLERGQISSEEENPRHMPQIIIVIDELADLMMVAAKEAESLIVRLAQLARAAGIHLIIATQRPSANVVTGLIKANIPSRVALKVASGLESRIIIDRNGAEELLGKGDMLFYPTGLVNPIRAQGAFVTDKEVNDTVNFLIRNKTVDIYADQAREIDDYISTYEESQAGTEDGAGSSGGSGKYDEFFHEAGLFCIENGKASSSMLQRRFSLGFNRAARIIDQLYEAKVIGGENGSKPREILVDRYTFEEICESLK
ncbi:MAG: DNA translocase FtsK [Lachnospiraceae bacterium]|nr:DNA translocase FtsK [Lachnospiraceae bacterium]